MIDILEPILKSPKFPQYLKQLQEIAAEENRKRMKFYKEVTEQEKAEFIEGEIICHSPVRIEHNVTGKLLLKLIDTFVFVKKLGFVGYEKILVKLTRNDYEPDICFFRNEKSQKFKPKQMFFPAPDFIVEILSESTEKRDRGIKFEDYALHEVGEYWIIDSEKKIVEQYLLNDLKYELNLKSGSGTIKSIEIDGFEIPIKAIFDENENLLALQNLLK
jgi:Uma2 family endonuclease